MTSGINIIAISADIDLFKNERIFDKAWAEKYPGALWVSVLAEKLKESKFKVTTADVALSHVKQGGYWEAGKIGVIQHLSDPETEELIVLGAKPIALTAFESPLYVPTFYSVVASIAPKFSHRIMFAGLFNLFESGHGINYALRFPSFSEKRLQEIVPWGKRKFMSMVMGNKYAVPFSSAYLRHPLDVLKWLKKSLYFFKSKNNRKTFSSFIRLEGRQLQDERFSALIFFGKQNCLSLYGKGWENIKNLPRYYRNQLTPVFRKIKPRYIENKIEAIRKFKFGLCFENYSFPGYFTEKIIDYFVAGVIPVYLGAPDIERFIPPDSFIDVREYQSWDSLLDKLLNITDAEAMKMIDSARRFLMTPEGQLHTFEGFASFMEGIILQECGDPLNIKGENYSVIRTT